LVYQPFFEDFGPLNLGQTHSFCLELNKLIVDSNYKKAKIYHYCNENFKKKANAAYLMGAYQVIKYKLFALCLGDFLEKNSSRSMAAIPGRKIHRI